LLNSPRGPGRTKGSAKDSGPESPKQLSLLELAEPGPRDKLQGEEEFIARLKALVPEPIEVAFTNNRASIISVRAGASGRKTVRLQHAFRTADKATLKALARFIQKPTRSSRARIDAFLEGHQELLETLARERTAERRQITKGEHRDLEKILRQVMKEYGFKLPKVRITWFGRPTPNRSSIKFGTYCFKTGTITVHRELDSPEVPDYFVEYIVYHELLHGLFPPLPGQPERDCAHSSEFHRFEKKFKRYAEARKFEKWFLKEKLR